MKLFAYLQKSTNPLKKFTVELYDSEHKKLRTVHFGQKGASDYTIHKDRQRMYHYLQRHTHPQDWRNHKTLLSLRSTKEDWENPFTAGFWSRWLLWYSPSFESAKKNITRTFKIKFV